jgi:Na+-translocating ferredoxin:NAD+ oxidoreductase RnfG subunit
LCPWREPETDLKLFFPEATRHELETRILSGLRLQLAARLGRTPTGDENALHVYRIYHDQTPLGTVLTRRAKGAFGAIELVLAVDTNGTVCGLRLQRLREPESIAVALQNPDWLRSFEGKRADSTFKLADNIPDVAAEARVSAEAITDGVRSLLILFAAAYQSNTQNPVAARHH